MGVVILKNACSVNSVKAFTILCSFRKGNCEGRHSHGFRLLIMQIGTREAKKGLSSASYASLLQDCGRREALQEGKLLHASILRNGFSSNLFVCNHLIHMYHKCGSLSDALHVFHTLPARNLVSWNIMIAGYAQNGYYAKSIGFFLRMLQEGFQPNRITFLNLLSACVSLKSLALGNFIHAHIIYTGLDFDVSVQSALLNMYNKYGDLEKAIRIFDKMPQRNLVSWNTMLSGFVQHGHGTESFKLFQLMEFEGFKPSKVSCITVLNTFSSLPSLPFGKLVHAYVVHTGMNLDITMVTALFSMYSRCGSVKDAQQMFTKIHNRDIVAWNVMIACYVHHNCNGSALQLFHQLQREGMTPSRATFIGLLAACTGPEALAFGRMIHANIVFSALDSDVIIGNALVCMYGRCSDVKDAQRMFNKMSDRDVVTWSSIINVYSGLEEDTHAFKLFQQMQQGGVKPNKVTFMTLLNSCSCMEALTLGKLVHAQIIGYGIESDHSIGNTLISMYSKCGSMSIAWEIFNKMQKRDVVSWNVMLSGFFLCNYSRKAFQLFNYKEVIELFEEMQMECVTPNEVSWAIILSACSHAGFLNEGMHYFSSVSRDCGNLLTVEHCNCIVDLLSRAGWLDEAEAFINKMPLRPNAVTWMTLLCSCRLHGCIEWGKYAAECISQLNPDLPSTYVMLSNAHAAAGPFFYLMM